MGVKMLLKWKSAQPSTEQRAYDPLCRAAESLKGSKKQPWRVDCIALEAVQAAGAPKARQGMYQVNFQDEQDTAYLVLSSCIQVMATDASISEKGGLMEKVGQHYGAQKRGIRYEGVRYVLGDFKVAVAQATGLAGSKDFVGVMVELEYLPVSAVPVGAPILEDFAAILQEAYNKTDNHVAGSLLPVAAALEQSGLPENFTRLHSAVQFMCLCRIIAK